jgi:F420H(2)-dependent quinone reductase
MGNSARAWVRGDRPPPASPWGENWLDMANSWRILGSGAHAVNRSLHRASGGRVLGKLGGRLVLLITVAGRKTGTLHTNPVMYLEDDGRLCVTGSADGSAAEPWWFKDRRSTREAEIEIGRRKLAVGVAVATGEQRDILWKKLVARTLRRLSAEGQRQMPLAILMPSRGVANRAVTGSEFGSPARGRV